MWKQFSSCGSVDRCIRNDDYVYYLKGDSTIGSFTYKKVFKRGMFSQLWFDEGPPPKSCQGRHIFNQLYALIRQEGHKIYMWKHSENILIYNFNLKVGDTLPQTDIQDKTNLVVLSIDSILVETEYRKRFHFGDFNFLIEGIGNTKGLLQHFETYCEKLQCYSINGKTYFAAEGELPCHWTVSAPK